MRINFYHVGANLAAAHNSNRRNAHAFAVDIGGQSHRAWRCAANVGVMGAVGDVERADDAVDVGRRRNCLFLTLSTLPGLSTSSKTPITSVTSGKCVPPAEIVERDDVAWPNLDFA